MMRVFLRDHCVDKLLAKTVNLGTPAMCIYTVRSSSTVFMVLSLGDQLIALEDCRILTVRPGETSGIRLSVSTLK